jgi:hypothetical protein
MAIAVPQVESAQPLPAWEMSWTRTAQSQTVHQTVTATMSTTLLLVCVRRRTTDGHVFWRLPALMLFTLLQVERKSFLRLFRFHAAKVTSL